MNSPSNVTTSAAGRCGFLAAARGFFGGCGSAAGFGAVSCLGSTGFSPKSSSRESLSRRCCGLGRGCSSAADAVSDSFSSSGAVSSSVCGAASGSSPARRTAKPFCVFAISAHETISLVTCMPFILMTFPYRSTVYGGGSYLPLMKT